VAQRTLLGIEVCARLGCIGFTSQRVFRFARSGRRIMEAGGLPVCGPGKTVCGYEKQKRSNYREEISYSEGTSVAELERFDLHRDLRSE
jgi:hypothetical protein